jgi:hypothetical protein
MYSSHIYAVRTRRLHAVLGHKMRVEMTAKRTLCVLYYQNCVTPTGKVRLAWKESGEAKLLCATARGGVFGS